MAKADCLETETLNFVCEKCGECCRRIEAFIEIWPYQQRGMCCFLQGDLCSIYEERPDFCDFKRAYGFLGKYMTEEEYRAKTILHCEQLKKKKIENENLYKQQK